MLSSLDIIRDNAVGSPAVRIASCPIVSTTIVIVTALYAAWAAGENLTETVAADPVTVQVARDRA